MSQAATVGFNFQANYCAASSYSGAVVTAPAFGIGTNAWESLSQIPTGYGCPCGFTTLSQVIDTSSNTNGLNPLPHGSLTVTWGAYAANVSGFGGYNRPGPYYTFGGNNEQPGNEQVYWGFLRDGVNFGPIETNSCGYSSGDNYEPGYNIDITGLKTLFTNSPFAVQLVAASDSLWGLTNAFIIDATANTTQSVVYPNIPTPQNSGGTLFDGTAFPRGIGGGLSTASGSVDTDHLKIIGNRAQHGAGFNLSSTIAGFIITDKPVISMQPRSVLANPADTIMLSAYAVGVPPMSYQWRQNGVAVAGATTTALSMANAVLADAGNYDLVVTNLYGSATSAVAAVTVDHITTTAGSSYVVDTNPQNAENDGINVGATWVASSTDGHSVTRTGLMSFNAAMANQIRVPASSTFNSPTGSIMFWMRSAGLANPAGNPAILLDRR
ncbi:MAG: immunoglobulin domain-containing protein, partial [Limisphaerales bacterium]